MTTTAPTPRRTTKKHPPTIEIESRRFYVREASEDLFKLSGVLDYGRLTHTPFLAFVPEHTPSGPKVTVHVIDTASEVAALPPETLVMVQWQGQWRSDFFRLTAGDVAEALDRK